MMRTPLLVLSAVTFTAIGAVGCRGAGEAAQDSPPLAARDTPAGAQECETLETRAPNASGQQPAFPGQTRACRITSDVALDVTVLARGLEHPWSIEPLPDGDLLVTERPGRLRIVTAAGDVRPPIAGLPAVAARGQGGLLDVALSPDFATDRTIFWSYSEPRDGGNGTSVARGVLSADRTRVDDVRVIVRTMPTYDGRAHFGSRLAFGPDGMLYITLGDRADARMRPQAQQLDSHLGKILRVRPDGTAPADNPFAGQAGALPEIWSLGHRNVQASSFDDAGRLWIVEHGTQGGDELNLIERGENYGWPVQAFGEEYRDEPIAGSSPTPEGFRQPVYYWDPVIAPSGAQYYTGDLFPEWRGSLLVGGLVERRLVRLRIEEGRVTGEEHLLTERGQRVRDVRQGSDGSVYVVTDEDDGEVWRLRPRR